MSTDSPAVVLFGTNSLELSIADGYAIPSTTPGVLAMVASSGIAHYLSSDSSGRPIVVGAGTDNTTNSTAKFPVIAAKANTSAPSWTDGYMAPLSVDTSGNLRVNIGTSGSLALDATLAKLTVAQSAALGSNTNTMVAGSVTTAAPTYTTGNINPLSLTTTGLLRVDASGTTVPTSVGSNATANLTNVSVLASSVTVLASNTSRKGAIIVNDSTVNVYLKFGSTASTTSYVAKLTAGSYYEIPFSYNGIITGIGDSATGTYRVTEILA